MPNIATIPAEDKAKSDPVDRAFQLGVNYALFLIARDGRYDPLARLTAAEWQAIPDDAELVAAEEGRANA